MKPLVVEHSHVPVFRVVRAGWKEPLVASYSQTSPDRRWNTADFPALYCCCSVRVARAVTRDLMLGAGLTVDDLQPAYRPRLLEIHWRGEVADVASPAGVEAVGLAGDYPAGVDKAQTRQLAQEWVQRLAGVMCRSASIHRLGFGEWEGSHEPWGELAIFVAAPGVEPPRLMGSRDTADWL